MAAGMYLEHYLDSKSRLEEGVRGHRVVVGGGNRAEEIYVPEVPSLWFQGHNCEGVPGEKILEGMKKEGAGQQDLGLALGCR